MANNCTFNDTMVEFLPKEFPPALYAITLIVIVTGIPLILLAIYALFSMVRKKHVVPVYVINLLISDLIQLCCLAVEVAEHSKWICRIISCIYFFGVLASVAFMVCVALERYLVIACPLWYRFKRNVKVSVVVSVLVWAVCFMEFFFGLIQYNIFSEIIFRSVLLLLPFPVLIFSVAGTIKVLSTTASVPPKEKFRILGTLVLVLLEYTVLFLPWVIWLMKMLQCRYYSSYYYLYFLNISPLADLVLYIFIKKGTGDKLQACLCCCKTVREEEEGKTGDDKITEDKEGGEKGETNQS